MLNFWRTFWLITNLSGLIKLWNFSVRKLFMTHFWLPFSEIIKERTKTIKVPQDLNLGALLCNYFLETGKDTKSLKYKFIGKVGVHAEEDSA